MMHVTLWAERLANGGGEARSRFLDALEALAPDAGSVLAPPDGETALIGAGILARPMADAAAAWRSDVAAILGPLGITLNLADAEARPARAEHGEAFRWLWGEFTSVRRSEPGATW